MDDVKKLHTGSLTDHLQRYLCKHWTLKNPEPANSVNKYSTSKTSITPNASSVSLTPPVQTREDRQHRGVRNNHELWRCLTSGRAGWGPSSLWWSSGWCQKVPPAEEVWAPRRWAPAARSGARSWRWPSRSWTPASPSRWRTRSHNSWTPRTDQGQKSDHLYGNGHDGGGGSQWCVMIYDTVWTRLSAPQFITELLKVDTLCRANTQQRYEVWKFTAHKTLDPVWQNQLANN